MQRAALGERQDGKNFFHLFMGQGAFTKLLTAEGFSLNGRERNLLYQNDGSGRFRDVGEVVAVGRIEDGGGFAIADFDGDGDLDVVLRNQDPWFESWPVLVYLRNEVGSHGRAVCVRLKGTRSNRHGIGARLILEAGGRRQVREIRAGSGFCSQHDQAAWFGVGEAEKIDRLTVFWPSGESQVFEQLPGGGTLRVDEGVAAWNFQPFRGRSVQAVE